MQAIDKFYYFFCYILQSFFGCFKGISYYFSEIDYIPTQYICELIKVKGFDGIKFKSSLGKGNHILLFTSKNVRIQKVKLARVKDIIYEFEECDSQ